MLLYQLLKDNYPIELKELKIASSMNSNLIFEITLIEGRRYVIRISEGGTSKGRILVVTIGQHARMFRSIDTAVTLIKKCNKNLQTININLKP